MVASAKPGDPFATRNLSEIVTGAVAALLILIQIEASRLTDDQQEWIFLIQSIIGLAALLASPLDESDLLLKVGLGVFLAGIVNFWAVRRKPRNDGSKKGGRGGSGPG